MGIDVDMHTVIDNRTKFGYLMVFLVCILQWGNEHTSNCRVGAPWSVFSVFLCHLPRQITQKDLNSS